MKRVVQSRKRYAFSKLTSALILALLWIGGLTFVVAQSQTELPTPQALQATPNPGRNWGNTQIGAPLLWQSDYTGEGIVVAIIDTGIDANHPAFAGTDTISDAMDVDDTYRDGHGIRINPADPTGDPFLVGPLNDPLDYKGHGTRMASIVAAPFVDGRTKGVAYEAKVVSIKALYLREVEDDRQIITGAVDGGFRMVNFDILTSTTSPDAVLDVILTWEGLLDLELEVLPPTPTITYTAGQDGDYFAAVTSIPLQERYGSWQARVTGHSVLTLPFTLTVKRWEWHIEPRVIERAIDEAIAANADVINLSMGTGPELDAAVEGAVEEGVVVVTSAGNVSSTLTSWNRREITVGATNVTDTLWISSAHGPAPPDRAGIRNTKPDVVAPGFENYTANSRYSFGSQEDYICVTGTSLAAAHVSGGVALLIQYLTKMTGRQPPPSLIKTILMGTAVDVGIGGPPTHPGELKLGKDNYSGAGRIDLYRALTSFVFTGTAGLSWDDFDEVTLRTPANLPDVPAIPLKGTLYWDEAQFYGFQIIGGDSLTTTADTYMSTFLSPTVGMPHSFELRRSFAGEGDVWYFVTTHPPIPQIIDDQFVRGYYYTNTVVFSDSVSIYTITVPALQKSDPLRILAYWPDHTINVDLMVFKTGEGTFNSVLEDVAVEQVVTFHEPASGDWTLWVWSSYTVPVTLMSSYPFDFSLSHSVYLPISIREP